MSGIPFADAAELYLRVLGEEIYRIPRTSNRPPLPSGPNPPPVKSPPTLRVVAEQPHPQGGRVLARPLRAVGE